MADRLNRVFGEDNTPTPTPTEPSPNQSPRQESATSTSPPPAAIGDAPTAPTTEQAVPVDTRDFSVHDRRSGSHMQT